MILITGGAGFIGSYFTKYLNDQGFRDIVIVDRLHSEDKWKNLVGLFFQEFIHADKFWDSSYYQNGADFTAVFHFGACSQTTEKNVDYLMENNFHYSKKIAQWATRHKLYFSYASSAAVYGRGERGLSDDHKLCQYLMPMNPYGYSKLLFDEWMLAQKELPKRWQGFRFFNVFGPNEYHKGKMRSVALQAFEQITAKDEVKLFKSYNSQYQHGEQLRDFIYVDDVAKVLFQLWQQSASDNGIYNLGTGHARSFNQLTQAVFAALNKKPNIVYIDMPPELRTQYQYFTQAEMSKIHQVLPEFKFRTLEQAVQEYCDLYLSQAMLRASTLERGPEHGQNS